MRLFVFWLLWTATDAFGVVRPLFTRPVSTTGLCMTDFVDAEDLEALQSLFSQYCDPQGLMTKQKALKIPAFVELLEDEELLLEEFETIWDRAAKFPDAGDASDRIDVDSFVQIYRDIDDLFEDEEDDKENETTEKTQTNTTTDQEEEDDQDPGLENELEGEYETLCDAAGLLGQQELRKWEEVSKLVEEGLLGEEEFDDIWKQTKKSAVSAEKLDLQGFLSFNVALDDLFDFNDEEMDDISVPEEVYQPKPPQVQSVRGDDLTPDVLFIAIADAEGLVGMDELKRWQELRDMVNGGDLLKSELDDIFRAAAKSPDNDTKLGEEGFLQLYNAIDDLFEEEDEDEESTPTDSASVSSKQDLMDAIGDLDIEGFLPCGLEALESEQSDILEIVEDLEKQETNILRSKGNVEPMDLDGTWELLYTSSSAMRFNKGLSGLGGSVPNGKFGSLQQRLKASKFLTDVEYTERIEVNPSSASFDVSVTGTWDLRQSISIFTGEPSITLSVVPDLVTYGPTSTRADHWKSLGPMNMLDISYLDDDLRIMRGNTSVETIFVFRRVGNA